MLSCSQLLQDQCHKSKLFLPKQVSSYVSLMLMDLGGKQWSNQAVFGGIQVQYCFIMHTQHLWIRSSSSLRHLRSSSALISHSQKLKTHTKMPLFAKTTSVKSQHLHPSVLLEWLLWGIKLTLCYLSVLRRFGTTQHCSIANPFVGADNHYSSKYRVLWVLWRTEGGSLSFFTCWECHEGENSIKNWLWEW